MKAKRKFSYYTFDKILSYNGVFNFVLGSRGLGKTYGAKKLVFRNFFKRGEQFIYMRRYKDELKTARNTFFADIQPEFPDYDFRVVGEEAQCSPVKLRDEKKRQWKTMGYFIELSTSQSRKSVAYPLVTLILFDEFIIEKGLIHYIPDEATVFTNFFSTVDRYQDKTRVLFLANSVSIMNPYFMEYDIFPDQVKEYGTKDDGFIAYHFADSKQFNNEVYATRFGKFIKGKSYADYAVESRFRDNHDSLTGDKEPTARYAYSIETTLGTFSVWLDWSSGQAIYFIQSKRPKQEELYTLIPEAMSEGKTLLLRNSKRLQMLRAAFTQARTVFDTPKSRNAFIKVFES